MESETTPSDSLPVNSTTNPLGEATQAATLPADPLGSSEQASEQGANQGTEAPVEPINPEEIDQLLLDDLSAIRKKVKNKKPLNAGEIKRLQAYKAASQQSDDSNVMEPVWARSQVELAQHLGCSRRQLARYLKIEGDDAAPAPTSDGRYNVTLWKIWAQDHGHLRKKLAGAADRQLLEDRTIQLRNEKLEIENAVRRGELMSVDEVCRVISEMYSAARDSALAMTHGTAPRVSGLPVPEITKRLRSDLNDAFFAKLSLGEWAKKKVFLSKVSAHLSGLREKFSLGDGQSVTS